MTLRVTSMSAIEESSVKFNNKRHADTLSVPVRIGVMDRYEIE